MIDCRLQLMFLHLADIPAIESFINLFRIVSSQSRVTFYSLGEERCKRLQHTLPSYLYDVNNRMWDEWKSQAKHVCYILWQTLMYYVCSTTILLEVCYALQNIERVGSLQAVSNHIFPERRVLFPPPSLSSSAQRRSLMLKGLRYTRCHRASFPHKA